MDVSEDLEPERFPEVSWKPGEAAASLDAVYEWVQAQAIRAANWYLRERRSKSRASRLLRVAATLFATAGAALPFVAANSDNVGFEWGYVLLALAAGAVALDRFLGLSTAWMRYMTAELAIQQRLQALQFQWATIQATRRTEDPSPEEVATQLTLLAQAAADINEEIRTETLTWIDEFRTNINDLHSLANDRRAAS